MPSEFELAAEALEISDSIVANAFGDSMRPLLKENRDIVTIKRLGNSLKRGDVVLYPDRAGVKLLLSRVIRIKGDDVVLRGDNEFSSQRRKSDEIIGKMISFSKDGVTTDCETDKKYRRYTFFVLNTAFLRRLFSKKG